MEIDAPWSSSRPFGKTIAVALGCLTGASATFQGAPLVALAEMPTQPTPVPVTMANGSLAQTCEDFYFRMKGGNLRLPNMKPGEEKGQHFGFTTARFGYTVPSSFSYSSNQGFYCGPLDKNFDDLGQCLKDCVVSLRAFAGICGPAQSSGANFCAQVTDPNDAQVIPTGDSYYWTWLAPNQDANSTCGKEFASYNGDAAGHEQLHIDDANEIASKKTAMLREQISAMKACASSELEAAQLLTAQMQEAALKAADQALSDWLEITSARDSPGLNTLSLPNCIPCP